MNLYIGNKYQGDTTLVQSIFRLAGGGEDALTFALGFLMANDYVFCRDLVKRLRLSLPRALKSNYTVHLQEVTDQRFGCRDIVIEDDELRIVLEAKIGGAEATADQLLKYCTETDMWNQYELRGLVALTQVELTVATRETILSNVSAQGIRFSNVQWHEVLDVALSRCPI